MNELHPRVCAEILNLGQSCSLSDLGSSDSWYVGKTVMSTWVLFSSGERCQHSGIQGGVSQSVRGLVQRSMEIQLSWQCGGEKLKLSHSSRNKILIILSTIFFIIFFNTTPHPPPQFCVLNCGISCKMLSALKCVLKYIFFELFRWQWSVRNITVGVCGYIIAFMSFRDDTGFVEALWL